MIRRLMLVVTAALVAVATTWAPRPAAADVGVALDVGTIDVTDPLDPGTDVDLPPLAVRNPGSEASTYRLDVVTTIDRPGQPIERSWLVIPKDQHRLPPGTATSFDLALQLPDDIEPGRYEGVIAAELVDEGGLTGAAAGATVRFEVRAADAGPWTPPRGAWVLAAVVAGAVLAAVVRRGESRSGAA